jgi:hypothetical protein
MRLDRLILDLNGCSQGSVFAKLKALWSSEQVEGGGTKKVQKKDFKRAGKGSALMNSHRSLYIRYVAVLSTPAPRKPYGQRYALQGAQGFKKDYERRIRNRREEG